MKEEKAINYSNSIIGGTDCAIVDGNNLWILTSRTDTLLRIDLSVGKVLEAFPIDGGWTGEYAHHVLTKCGNNIQIYPNHSGKLFSFNTESSEFTEYQFTEKNHYFRFSAENKEKDYVYLFGLSHTGIVKFNRRSMDYSRIEGVTELLENAGINLNDNLIFVYGCVRDNKVYVPVARSEYVFVFDMGTEN